MLVLAYIVHLLFQSARLLGKEYTTLVVAAEWSNHLLEAHTGILPFNACVVCGKRIYPDDPILLLSSSTYCHYLCPSDYLIGI